MATAQIVQKHGHGPGQIRAEMFRAKVDLQGQVGKLFFILCDHRFYEKERSKKILVQYGRWIHYRYCIIACIICLHCNR